MCEENPDSMYTWWSPTCMEWLNEMCCMRVCAVPPGAPLRRQCAFQAGVLLLRGVRLDHMHGSGHVHAAAYRIRERLTEYGRSSCNLRRYICSVCPHMCHEGRAHACMHDSVEECGRA